MEISGLQSSGKSTLAFHAVRECQKLKEKVVYFDLENGLDMDYVKSIGVDAKKLILSYPHSGEEAFEMLTKFVEMDVSLIVVDSVSNLVPRAQLETSLEKTRIGSHAALMSAGLRKVKNKLINKRTIIIFINQLRNNINIGSYVGNVEVTTGGMALQYESDLRLRLKHKGKIERNGGISGIRVEVKVIKNRFSKPYGITELELDFPKGIRRSKEIIKIAIEQNIITKKGSSYSFKDEKVGNSLEGVINFLDLPDNFKVLKEVEEQIVV